MAKCGSSGQTRQLLKHTKGVDHSRGIDNSSTKHTNEAEVAHEGKSSKQIERTYNDEDDGC
jgi:hypothetical protein